MSDEIRIKWANDRLQRINNGEPITDVYNDLGQYDHFDNPLKHMRLAMGDDHKVLAKAYLAEHAPKPLEAYLVFANVLCIEQAELGYDAAVAVAKAMHKRGMVIPNE